MDERAQSADTTHKPRRRWLLATVFGGLGLLIVAGAAWRISSNKSGPRGAAHAHGATPSVTAAIAGPGTIEDHLSELGTVTPLASVTVKTQITGVLESVQFTEGQMVQQGDFLAQIDDRPYQAALAQDQGTLARDQALLDQAQTDLTRYQKLLRQDSIARQTVEDQAQLVKQYQGSVAADQAQIAAQQLNIAYCHITAPITGRVGLRAVDAGNYVTPSDSNGIVTITQLQPISVIYSIPEDSIPALQQARAGGAPIPVALYDRADSVRLAEGQLATVNNQIETATGTLSMRALFDNDDGSLVPNQFVNADMLVATHKNVLSIPIAALQSGAPGSFVYRIDPATSLVHIITVTTGVQDAGRVQILSGLAAGDEVVTDGIDRLRDGIAVKVASLTPAPGSGPIATPGADGSTPHHHHTGHWPHRQSGDSPAAPAE